MVTSDRVRQYLEPYRAELEKLPLVITLDKDVMRRGDAIQNWNSGFFSKDEVSIILEVLAEFTTIAVVDILGEWSPVKARGIFRKWLHSHQHDEEYQHESLDRATEVNQRTNLYLLDTMSRIINA